MGTLQADGANQLSVAKKASKLYVFPPECLEEEPKVDVSSAIAVYAGQFFFMSYFGLLFLLVIFSAVVIEAATEDA